MNIICVGGFLGEKRDFDPLISELSTQYKGIKEIQVINPCGLSDWNTFVSRGQAGRSQIPNTQEDFNLKQAWLWGVHSSVSQMPKPRVGIGYSMGGRILLMLLEKDPALFDAVVIISSHPGIDDQEQRQVRIEQDEQWSSILSGQSWDFFIDQWNSQPVLRDTRFNPRSFGPQEMPHLSRVMREFSLGRQKDYHSMVAQILTPQLWVSGAKDAKFVQLHSALKGSGSSNLQVEVIPESGHRVLFDQPQALGRVVGTWLKSLFSSGT